MFDDFYKDLANDINYGIDDFLNDTKNLRMSMSDLSVYEFPKESFLGSGTYGVVKKARCKQTNDVCAIKHLQLDKEIDGFPITAMREIKLLQTLKHRNLVNLKEVCYEIKSSPKDFKMDFHLVFEYCHSDLNKVLREAPPLNFMDRRKIMFQLLKGIEYMHKENFMHRDLKPANILISPTGDVKIADFGLSRKLKKLDAQYTNGVVTLWYRAPEVLLNIRNYTKAIDIWSLGCIFYELWTKEPLLKGENEFKQLGLMFDLCGGMSNSVWPDIEQILRKNNISITFHQSKLPGLLDKKKFEKEASKLICKMLCYDPLKRHTAEGALNQQYLKEMPLPTGSTTLKMGYK